MFAGIQGFFLFAATTAPSPLPGTGSGSAFTGFLDVQKVIDTAQNFADNLAEISLVIAFVLLVVSAVQNFLRADQRHFFGTVLRLMLITSLIFGGKTWRNWLDQAANGITKSTVATQMQLTSTGKPVMFQYTLQPDLAMIDDVLNRKYPNPQNTTNSNETPTGPNSSQSNDKSPSILQFNAWFAWQLMHSGSFEWAMGFVRNLLLWLVLLLFRSCDFVVRLMQLLQQVILIFLSIYLPIGLAELTVHSLRSQGVLYLKTLVGAYCWPVGWVFVNIITVGLLDGMSQIDPLNLGSILLGLIAIIPIFFWTLIGHFLAPFYAQKIVTHGGAALQGFAGSMLAATGPLTGAAYSGIASTVAAGIRQVGGGLSNMVNGFGRGLFGAKNSQAGAANSVGQDRGLPALADGRAFASGLARTEFPGNRGGSRGGRTSSSSKAKNLVGGIITGAADALAAPLDTADSLTSVGGNLMGSLGSLTAHAAGDSVGAAHGLSSFGALTKRNGRVTNSSNRAQQYMWD